ncbi:acetylglutamate kinase [Pelagophyceae sp. CCMP2097]|nr:acetylglutamate kinase [Pelagophyceae sp. CCMP2097]
MQRLVWAAAVACVGGFVHPGGGVVRRRAVDVRLTGGEIYETLAAFGAHASQRVVVKYGGHAMSDDRAAQCFAEDVLMQKLGLKPIVVHGGGPQIGDMLKRLGMTSTFIDGLRVTDAETVKISEMILCGSINKGIAAAITRAGGHAIGLSGKDDGLIVAEKLLMKRTAKDGSVEEVDLGFVGDPIYVNAELINKLSDEGIVPVIAPIAIGANGETYSVNADTAAGAVAEAIQASRLLLLTDVKGVLDDSKTLISMLTPSAARALIVSRTINGGMIPKIQTAVQAVERGVGGAAIVDGRADHAILIELCSPEGASATGTLVTAGH